MGSLPDSFLTGANIDFIEAQYALFLDNPQAVGPQWRDFFASLEREGRPLVIDGLTLPPRPKVPAAAVAQPGEDMGLQAKVDQAIMAFRLRGHLIAQLDPLGTPRKTLDHVADLGLVAKDYFTAAELEQLVSPLGAFDEARVPLSRVLERMRRTYCHHVGVEFQHMFDSSRRRWLQGKMESIENSPAFSVDEQRRILRKVTEAETFETTIHTKFQAAKRFSGEGADAMLPMIDACLELAGPLGVREVVFGMAHRGRLNVLCNLMGKPAEEIFSEFAGPTDPTRFLNRGDVKYHMGFSSDRTTSSGHTVHLTLAFNPSHLGVVHPVVEGRVRAKQERDGQGADSRRACMPFLIHGDAAFSGQGLVAETLNLAGLDAYDTGGTVHLVVNNQIGYTTLADQGRSALYCTGMAQMLDIPIFHVNGDDLEACVHVMRLATEYRQRFQSDVVIDLVCYRKYGHNEGDEPAFTQPAMYQLIKSHPSPRQVYAKTLAERRTVSAEESAAVLAEVTQRFADAHASARQDNKVKEPSAFLGLWKAYVGGPDKDAPQVDTGVPLERLQALLTKLATVPPGFELHPNIQRGVIEARQRMVAGEDPLDWGAGEMLAYATLVTEGSPIRVTGQDTERGTFAHRQAVLHDRKTGKKAFPLGGLDPRQARTRVVNSPLSEMACLAFEFGFSLDSPDSLVVWEAQFGDFANNAQVIIDQFLVAAEDKWRRMNALVLLLPHGYEGAGPEHSSARLERFLELAAEDNIQVCYPTSSAQIFHLLRRQVRRPLRKPLVVLTPKSLLRLAEARSPWDDFTRGTYLRVIGETSPEVKPSQVTRLLLCSGKVYFDLKKARDAAKDFTIALARLEQLYPLPQQELLALFASLPRATEVFWVQEEPRNAGAWRALFEPLSHLLDGLPNRPRLKYVGRPESASPATGFTKSHTYEQQLLVAEAIARGT
ncbi:MAG: 2-oxoglutarate dehydrogenase E1 component [Myxococcales bacterium]|nr:2-oxoglutarate dehydrogenase E1 component [Myxococcales bacterium]